MSISVRVFLGRLIRRIFRRDGIRRGGAAAGLSPNSCYAAWSWCYAGKVWSRNTRGLVFRFVAALPFESAALAHHDLPRILALVPRNTTMSGRASTALPLVAAVLRIRARPKICLSVVQLVPVDMVNRRCRWVVQQIPVHPNRSPVPINSRQFRNRVALWGYPPRKLRQSVNVLVVH